MNIAINRPTTKQTLQDLTEPAATAPGLTGDEFEQVVTTKIVRKRIGSLDPTKATWGWFAPHFGCPSGMHLVLRDGQTVLVAADFIRNTDTVNNPYQPAAIPAQATETGLRVAKSSIHYVFIALTHQRVWMSCATKHLAKS